MLRWIVKHESGLGLHSHAAVAVGHMVFAFGTDTLSDQLNVNVFNAVSLRWARVPPVTTTTGRGQRRPPEVPPELYFHTAVLAGYTVYIFGGVACETYALSDALYAFDVVARSWVDVSGAVVVSGTPPEARRDHSACVVGGRFMYVFGGYVHRTRLDNDLYKLDTVAMVWTSIEAGGFLPPASIYHSANVIGTKMLVFGGLAYNEGYVNHVRVFDTETSRWLDASTTTPPSSKHESGLGLDASTTTPPSSSGARLPEACIQHSAFVHAGELYVFGVQHYSQNPNEHVWRFSPGTVSWTRVEPRGEGPSQRDSRTDVGCCCVVVSGDRVVLCANGELNVLDLRPRLKTLSELAVTVYGLETSELPHDIRWELAAMTGRPTTRRQVAQSH